MNGNVALKVERIEGGSDLGRSGSADHDCFMTAKVPEIREGERSCDRPLGHGEKTRSCVRHRLPGGARGVTSRCYDLTGRGGAEIDRSHPEMCSRRKNLAERLRDDFLVFGAPQIEEDEIAEIVDSLRARWIGTGPKVREFEQAFAAYKGTRHAVAVSSCTAALHLSLIAAGIGPGDEVIVPAMTFCATVNAVIHAGGTPVLADVDPIDFNITLDSLSSKLTDRTRAIVPVHFAGRACDLKGMMNFAREQNLVLIEDCAHAIESTRDGMSAGTAGKFGCFSFYATKNVTTAEGGMVITDDAEAADRIRRLALHGLSADAWTRYSDRGFKHYFVNELGFKYNMTDLQASLGIHQLQRIESNWRRRQEIWNRYQGSSMASRSLSHRCHLLDRDTLIIFTRFWSMKRWPV